MNVVVELCISIDDVSQYNAIASISMLLHFYPALFARRVKKTKDSNK